MSTVDYRRLRVLVADDFSNFRTTVNGMLTKLGVGKVDATANGTGVLEACESGFYDVILCDYDLGRGKNGQQVLEELRHRAVITQRTLFIIISADAAKDVVMATYDCVPDDYLMKPITAKMLQQRMDRLLGLRGVLLPVYQAKENNDLDQAVFLLTELSLQEGRAAVVAQKMLGELFVQRGELGKAEKLYSKALEARQPDWARLGLARVKRLRGDTAEATQHLERLVSEKPLFLPAYDEIANTWEHLGDSLNLQTAVQNSVVISPKSILRQKRLAEVAERNGDFEAALSAYRATVQLGEWSCHATAEDNLGFARVAANGMDKKVFSVDPLSTEVLETLNRARSRYELSDEQLARAALLEGRALVLGGSRELGRNKIAAAAEHSDANACVDTQLEQIRAMQTLGDRVAADDLLRQMLERHRGDEAVLIRLDGLLEEPVSESNRALVANINREGIDLYNHGRHDEALACFEKARRLFPKHVGIQLNIVQALVGKLKAGEQGEELHARTRKALGEVARQLEPAHPQYDRFMRLQDMAQASIS